MGPELKSPQFAMLETQCIRYFQSWVMLGYLKKNSAKCRACPFLPFKKCWSSSICSEIMVTFSKSAKWGHFAIRFPTFKRLPWPSEYENSLSSYHAMCPSQNFQNRFFSKCMSRSNCAELGVSAMESHWSDTAKPA